MPDAAGVGSFDVAASAARPSGCAPAAADGGGSEEAAPRQGCSHVSSLSRAGMVLTMAENETRSAAWPI